MKENQHIVLDIYYLDQTTRTVWLRDLHILFDGTDRRPTPRHLAANHIGSCDGKKFRRLIWSGLVSQPILHAWC